MLMSTAIAMSLTPQNDPPENSPDPSLAKARGKRVIIFDETSDTDVYNEKIVKRWTGGGLIRARGLHENGVTFRASFNVIVATNDMTPFKKGGDNAIWERLVVIPFLSHFADNPDPLNEREFKKDIRLKQEIENNPDIRRAWMKLLLSYYHKYKAEGLGTPPPEVAEATLKYKNNSNTYSDFLCNNCDKAAESHVVVDELFELYRDWMAQKRGVKIKYHNKAKTVLIDSVYKFLKKDTQRERKVENGREFRIINGIQLKV